MDMKSFSLLLASLEFGSAFVAPVCPSLHLGLRPAVLHRCAPAFSTRMLKEESPDGQQVTYSATFTVWEARWPEDQVDLSKIRREVFIDEQKVSEEEEWDGMDEDSWHWLARDTQGQPVGTARLLPDGQIGRMAVVKGVRSTGVGSALLQQAVTKARELGFAEASLNAQTHAVGFYQRFGFLVHGGEFTDAGIPHVQMKQTLK